MAEQQIDSMGNVRKFSEASESGATRWLGIFQEALCHRRQNNWRKHLTEMHISETFAETRKPALADKLSEQLGERPGLK